MLKAIGTKITLTINAGNQMSEWDYNLLLNIAHTNKMEV